MAKLRKLEITAYAKDSGRHTYSTYMEYNPGGQVFFTRVPNEQLDFIPEGEDKIASTLSIKGAGWNTRVFYAKSEDEVIKDAGRFYKLYLARERSERPVIFYRLSYYSEKRGLQLNDDTGRWAGFRKCTNSLSVKFMVGKELKVAGSITHLKGLGEAMRHDITSQVTQGKYAIIDHTVEREAFFERLVAGMDDLVQMIHDATDDTTAMLNMIDNGGSLLMPHKETS